MILIDTNVLVALVDERDRLHTRAIRDLNKLTGPFGIMSVVLSEACFLLEESYLRDRLTTLLSRLPVVAVEPEAPWWREAFQWMSRYSDHTPDLCDAMLVLQSSRTRASIWTYDSEFRKIWRRPDGRQLTVVPASRTTK